MDKGIELNKSIEEKLEILPKKKNHAIDTILITEFLILESLEKELLVNGKWALSKGVVVSEKNSSGDCDIIIYEKGQEKLLSGNIVIVDKKYVRAIISILTKFNDLKNPRNLKAIEEYKNFTENIVVLARKDKFKGKWKSEKHKMGEDRLIEVYNQLSQNDIKIFVLSKEGDYDKLIQHLNNILVD